MNNGELSARNPELLSIKKLAHVLDCSPKTVRDWLYKNRKVPGLDPLPYYRLGGLVRFRASEVTAWVERRRVRVSALLIDAARTRETVKPLRGHPQKL